MSFISGFYEGNKPLSLNLLVLPLVFYYQLDSGVFPESIYPIVSSLEGCQAEVAVLLYCRALWQKLEDGIYRNTLVNGSRGFTRAKDIVTYVRRMILISI